MTKSINELITIITKIITNGQEVVFDCDQVLYDKGIWNTDLITKILSLMPNIKIASHGSTINGADFPYELVDHDTVMKMDGDMPAIDEHMRPIIAKILDKSMVLIDDRADEWAAITGNNNYVQYAWAV